MFLEMKKFWYVLTNYGKMIELESDIARLIKENSESRARLLSAYLAVQCENLDLKELLQKVNGDANGTH